MNSTSNCLKERIKSIFNKTTDNKSHEVKNIKVLAVGNSFSVDAMRYLYQILKNSGIKKVILGNLYIGGCSLQKHLDNAKSNNNEYVYYKNTKGKWKKHPQKSISYAMKDESWDFITMQQASGFSGIISSYGDTLKELTEIIKSQKPDRAKIIWHGTWAYQADSSHRHFVNYDCNQNTMYTQIIAAIKSQISDNKDFYKIIPNTTAIQNARTSFLGDTLTRDGFHLSYDIGRFIAGLTFFAVLTGRSVDDIDYNPSPDVITENVMRVVKESVKNAVTEPAQITNSQYKEL